MTIELTKELIRLQSVTPNDAGCQALLSDRLVKSGFKVKHYPHDEVQNILLTHGENGPVFCFLGHTDVVPTGPGNQWTTPPFEPTERDGYLYGRGAADMKGSVAAIVTAMERFIAEHPNHIGIIALLLTSDEEGQAIHGIRKVVDDLLNDGFQIKWCLVGEPSSSHSVGDTVKNGRRGSLLGRLHINGIQGHVAYPARASNPIHLVTPAINELCSKIWDQGNEFYSPTSFQISNINAGTGADNVIPGHIDVMFNFRYSTETTDEKLIKIVEGILNSHKLEYEMQWHSSGLPFLTDHGDLLSATQETIKEITGIKTELSTTGGTSDGRFIAPTGAEVIELGPVNETIHKINERVKIDDLNTLSRIYQGILEKLMR